MKKIILIAIILTISLSCASTTITSFRDPEFQKVSYKKILVIAPFYDLKEKQDLEKAFQNAFKGKEIDILVGIQVLPPTRSFSGEELIDILDTNGIDGILVVALADYWTKESYIPESYSRTEGRADVIGNSIYYNSTTRKTGGYYISKPRAKFECRLFDAKTGKIAWIGSAMTRGNAFADYEKLLNSFATTTVRKLVEEELTK